MAAKQDAKQDGAKDGIEVIETTVQDTPAVETPATEEKVVEDKGYVAPEVKSLGQTKPAASAQPKPAIEKVATQPAMREATFRVAEGTITISKMINAKGTATTDVILGRIEKHMKHLSGQLGFKNEEEKVREQLSFIETIGNTLRLDFPQYALVTDVLLNNIKANQTVFDKGLAFRFVGSLGKSYSQEHIKTYQTYMNFLAVVAKNWTTRNKLGNLVDVGYVTKEFPQKAKENVTQYFRRVTNG